MKLVVFGSRDYNDYEVIKEKLDKINNESPITEIVSGKCRGVDTLGERWAKENMVDIAEFPADWNKHGKAAGPIRNAEMAKYADRGAGFSLNGSNGTANMRDTLRGLGKYCYFWEISE